MAHHSSAAPPIPLGDLLPWAIFGGLPLKQALYCVAAEQRATKLCKGTHVHDGCHLPGFPGH